MSIFVWGFCGPMFDVVKELNSSQDIETYSVSDQPGSDLDIHELFFRRFPKSQPDLELQVELRMHLETFKELYSRHWFPREISDEEYLNYFNSYIDFFSSLYQRFSFESVIFSNVPHEGPDYIAFIVAKQKKMRTLIFYQSIFENRLFVSEKIDIFDSSNPKLLKNSDEDFKEVSSAVNKAVKDIGNWFYMCPETKSNHFTFIQLIKNAKKCIRKNIFLFFKLIYKDIRFLVEYHRNTDKNFSIEGEDFVYFPLHLQPELTTSILGNGFTDQITAIEHLSQSLPRNVKIVVKENPKQNSFKRPVGYYKKLKKIPRVILMPVNYPTLTLIKECRAVATINGTAGWEAINIGKPAIYYGICWYRDLPHAYKYTELKNFTEFSKLPIDTHAIQKTVSNFLSHYTIRGTVDYEYSKVTPDFDYTRNAKNLARYIVNYVNEEENKEDIISKNQLFLV